MRTPPVDGTSGIFFPDQFPGSGTGRTAAGPGARNWPPPGGQDDEYERLADDHERAEYFRGLAEEYRRQWHAGRSRELRHVQERALAGDNRFRGRTEGDLTDIARLRWSRSAPAARLARLEELFMRYSHMYLAFAEYDLHAEAAHHRDGRIPAHLVHSWAIRNLQGRDAGGIRRPHPLGNAHRHDGD